jgi:hypothetical protein
VTYLVTSAAAASAIERSAERTDISLMWEEIRRVWRADRQPLWRDDGHNEAALRAAKEFVVVILVALGAVLAIYMTSGQAFGQPRNGITVSPKIVICVVVVYLIVRATYALIAKFVELVSEKRDGSPQQQRNRPTGERRIGRTHPNQLLCWNASPDDIQGCPFGHISNFLRCHVATLTQGPLWPLPRITISLLLGGLYPAVVLTELSSSVPAAEDVSRPRWEAWIDRTFQ